MTYVFKGSNGVFNDKSKKPAREHCLLKSERPSQVTLLALTRDAVARLPNSAGTRGDVCALVRQSQFLAPIVTDAQVNTPGMTGCPPSGNICFFCKNLFFWALLPKSVFFPWIHRYICFFTVFKFLSVYYLFFFLIRNAVNMWCFAKFFACGGPFSTHFF